MKLTQYSDVNDVLDILLTRITSILGDKLVGLYLEGSLVLGDFEPSISDIDLLAALSSNVDDTEFEALKEMHDALVTEYKEWYDRIEVCYITIDALKTVKSQTSTIVNISPGEPIHRTESSKEWIMNWYLTRERSIPLFGPSPKDIIEPISKEEFIQSVKDHAKAWGEWVKNMRNPYAQSYAILSISRAFYACRNGDQVSKKQAALWAKKQLPEWSDVIHNALIWRQGGKYNPPDDVTHPKTVQFVNYVRGLILAE